MTMLIQASSTLKVIKATSLEISNLEKSRVRDSQTVHHTAKTEANRKLKPWDRMMFPKRWATSIRNKRSSAHWTLAAPLSQQTSQGRLSRVSPKSQRLPRMLSIIGASTQPIHTLEMRLCSNQTLSRLVKVAAHHLSRIINKTTWIWSNIRPKSTSTRRQVDPCNHSQQRLATHVGSHKTAQ